MKSAMQVCFGVAVAASIAAGSSAVGHAQGQKSPAGQPVGSIQIDGVAGGAIPIYGFAFNVTNTSTASGSGGGAGKATLSDIQVIRTPDSLSPSLFRFGVLGQHLPTVRVTVFGSGKTAPDAVYVLSDATVDRLANSDDVEELSFGFRKIEVAAGGTTFCFDVATNSAC
jgi:type VI secretion system secreted protein Hcp